MAHEHGATLGSVLALAFVGGCGEETCAAGELGCHQGWCDEGTCQLDLTCDPATDRCIAPDEPFSSAPTCEATSFEDVCEATCLAICHKQHQYCGNDCTSVCSEPALLDICSAECDSTSCQRDICWIARRQTCMETECNGSARDCGR